ncbi:hypothetical protein TAMA11512_22370 [Selenomonas sp. TAMA-11512]|uniref:flagellar hook-associated protein FlgK n=1 Tax=Selenomonas sp. TAMA-11512 TaxID=3095337 RepID=UPI003093DDDE|nr:hypothetical protein TAMA11512_22370 [Selenomonas sp. TAMA-11512]
MRSSFSGLNTMVKGIYQNQLSLETVGHNITNANTEGYSRQRVNIAATEPLKDYGMNGGIRIGTGADTASLTRARDVFADRQYWREEATQTYANTRQKNYDKLENIFNDSDNNSTLAALTKFFKAWQTAGTYASDSSSRVAVIEQGKQFADQLRSSAEDLQNQITSLYRDMQDQVDKVNQITDQIVDLNRRIALSEADGSMANDLRDKRDLLTDELSGYMSLQVYEMPNGMSQIVTNGASIVNGVAKLTVAMDGPVNNKAHGVSDYSLIIKETNTAFLPGSGTLQGVVDSIAEDKSYIDQLARMGAFMLTNLNDMHRTGAGIDPAATTDLNFYGETGKYYYWDEKTNTLIAADTTKTTAGGPPPAAVTTTKTVGATQEMLKGIQILEALTVNRELTARDGEKKLALRGYGDNSAAKNSAASNVTIVVNSKNEPVITGGTVTHTFSDLNGTADNSVGVRIAALFNMTQENVSYANMTYNLTRTDNLGTTTATDITRPIATISLNNFYNTTITELGIQAETVDNQVKFQENVMTQISNWRQSTAGVNWNEELSNMIKFQQGYQACARCLTTMDEMLDRLVNSTGMVGR